MARFETSEDLLKLSSYIQEKRPGTELSFMKVQDETGITMDHDGRSKLRRACQREKIEYLSIRGYGIKLTDPTTGMEAVSKRVVRIDNAVRRGERTTRNIKNNFINEMSEEDKKRLIYTGAIFGAIRAAASDSKYIYNTKPKEIKESKPHSLIPNFRLI